MIKITCDKRDYNAKIVGYGDEVFNEAIAIIVCLAEKFESKLEGLGKAVLVAAIEYLHDNDEKEKSAPAGTDTDKAVSGVWGNVGLGR